MEPSHSQRTAHRKACAWISPGMRGDWRGRETWREIPAECVQVVPHHPRRISKENHRPPPEPNNWGARHVALNAEEGDEPRK